MLYIYLFHHKFRAINKGAFISLMVKETIQIQWNTVFDTSDFGYHKPSTSGSFICIVEKMLFNSLPANCESCCMLIFFVNSLDLDQA